MKTVAATATTGINGADSPPAGRSDDSRPSRESGVFAVSPRTKAAPRSSRTKSPATPGTSEREAPKQSRPLACSDVRAGRDVLQVRDDGRFGEDLDKPLNTGSMTVGELITLSFGASDPGSIVRAQLVELAEDLEAYAAALYGAADATPALEKAGYRCHRFAMRARAALELGSRVDMANYEEDGDGSCVREAAE